jgi:hypothetical protein
MLLTIFLTVSPSTLISQNMGTSSQKKLGLKTPLVTNRKRAFSVNLQLTSTSAPAWVKLTLWWDVMQRLSALAKF